ncbi:hypothetical protein ABQD64_06305 [Vagococcus fluvialis]|uniref:hypothetical protein n=1 Tax=Vagococcus fluvialis TaxID=2738 RepID=UPI001A8F0B78|nr:hypothetical protein [Vagococcus fluvialis]MBO0442194.1 hypothetical protein [Vagococcus fluvialis]
MDNIKLLLQNNKKKAGYDIHKTKTSASFLWNEDYFSGATIKCILEFINKLLKTEKRKKIKVKEIYFRFLKPELKLEDKLTFIIFETICYSLMKDFDYKVHLFWEPKRSIEIDGVFSSPLKLLNGTKDKSHDKFLCKFKKEIHNNHFRKVINTDEDSSYLSILGQDIRGFLNKYNLSSDCKIEIAQVVTEMVGNAIEHSKSQCLIDIDITDPHRKVMQTNYNYVDKVEYYGVNIAILNYSEKLFHHELKKKLEIEKTFKNKAYQGVRTAYEAHRHYFKKNNYLEDDFWNIACLQDKVSGRIDKDIQGGTGSTVLIKTLQEKADKDKCYLISGKRSLFFIKEYLNYNTENWIGFNESNDFFKNIPDDSVVCPCFINFPGTAYNLNFVLKGEDDERI